MSYIAVHRYMAGQQATAFKHNWLWVVVQVYQQSCSQALYTMEGPSCRGLLMGSWDHGPCFTAGTDLLLLILHIPHVLFMMTEAGA